MNAKLEAILTHNDIKKERLESILSSLRDADWIKENTQGENKNNNAENSENYGYDSALICLAVELNIPLSNKTLCDYIPNTRKYLSRIDVLNALAHLGFIGHKLKIEPSCIDKRLLPCLYLPNNKASLENAPIVILDSVIEDNKKIITYYDCKTERTIRVNAEKIPVGKAYVFTKESEAPQPLSPEYMNASGFTWFRSLLERFKGLFWQVFTLSIMINIMAIAAPVFVMLVYDRVIGSYSPETLTPLIVGAMLALSCEGIMRLLRMRSLAWFSSRIDTIVGNHIFSKLITLPISFTETASVSSQIARIKAFESIRDFFNGPLFLALVEIPFTLIILSVIALIAGQLALIPIVIAGLYLILLYFTSNALRTATRIAAKNNAKKNQISFETFHKMHGIRASGITHQWIDEYRKSSGKASLSSFKASFISSQIEVVSHGLFVLAGLAIVYAGVMSVIEGQLTAGALIATTLLVWRVLTPFKILCNSLDRFEQFKNSVEQINRLMVIKSESEESQSHTRIPDLKGEISFNKVGIRYNKKNDPVFTGLTFTARRGDLLAITGGNGSGKSTILQLINGFYKPQAGNIRIDGLDTRQLDLIDLRKNIAYVPQVPHFFSGTIAENLRMADPLITNKAIKVALNQVDAWSEVCELPAGLETPIGLDGNQLPSGLSYKLNLARAYLKNAALVLIDELPYALLNSDAGKVFKQTIERWKGHRTVMLVTHREDYINMADTVILLATGDFPMVGTPKNIIEAINKSNY